MGSEVRLFQPIDFDDLQNIAGRIIAPYWNDADASNSGNIFYRIINTREQFVNIQEIVSSTFPSMNIQLLQAFVVTYDEVPQFMLSGSLSSIVSHPQFLVNDYYYSFF